VLACAASGVLALLVISAATTGVTSSYALLAVGFCNSIMFPTIFSLACEGLEERRKDPASSASPSWAERSFRP
jgi:FHS family L-fucose permease-like MFS transporter